MGGRSGKTRPLGHGAFVSQRSPQGLTQDIWRDNLVARRIPPELRALLWTEVQRSVNDLGERLAALELTYLRQKQGAWIP